MMNGARRKKYYVLQATVLVAALAALAAQQMPPVSLAPFEFPSAGLLEPFGSCSVGSYLWQLEMCRRQEREK